MQFSLNSSLPSLTDTWKRPGKKDNIARSFAFPFIIYTSNQETLLQLDKQLSHIYTCSWIADSPVTTLRWQEHKLSGSNFPSRRDEVISAYSILDFPVQEQDISFYALQAPFKHTVSCFLTSWNILLDEISVKIVIFLQLGQGFLALTQWEKHTHFPWFMYCKDSSVHAGRCSAQASNLLQQVASPS